VPRPADFGLVAIPGGAGLAIKVGQGLNGSGWGDYQHAVFALSATELIGAEPRGARIRPVSYYDGTNIVWSDWDLADDVRLRAATYARTLEGIGYSALDYYWLAAHRLHIPVPGLRQRILNSHRLICSQLCDHCLTHEHVTVFDDGRWEGDVTPMDLRAALHGPVRAL
jgi:hypothetical protein